MLREMWSDTKRILFIFALGLGTGGYLLHEYVADPLKYADRGYCAKRDIANTRFWINCNGGAEAMEREIRRDSGFGLEQPDPIGDIIRATETVGKFKKAKVRK